MKTFKEFRQQKSKKKPSEEASFGKHSQGPVGKRKPSDEASFGAHSQEPQAKKINEELNVSKDEEATKEDHDHLHKNVAPVVKMTPHEKDAITTYTDHSTPLNFTLFHHHNGHNYNKGYKKHIDGIDSAMNKAETKDDMHVYTGLKRSPTRHFDKGDTHKEVHFPGFVSASTSLGMARTFTKPAKHENDKNHEVNHGLNSASEEDGARHVLKIHVPKGSKAMSLKKHSFLPKEQEILLHRGHDIEIHHKPEIHTDHKGRVTHIWHGKLTGHYPGNLDADDL